MQAIQALLSTLPATDADAWAKFQARISTLKLQRAETQRSLTSLQAGVAAAAIAAAESSDSEEEVDAAAAGSAHAALHARGRTAPVQVVLVTGFESFNQSLYRAAAKEVPPLWPGTYMHAAQTYTRTHVSPGGRAAVLLQSSCSCAIELCVRCWWPGRGLILPLTPTPLPHTWNAAAPRRPPARPRARSIPGLCAK